MLKRVTQSLGIIGTIGCIYFFITEPSFPTPDKLLVMATFIFMSFGQGWKLFKHLAPFVGLLLLYESFRSIVPQLNNHVNYTFMPAVDKTLFGGHLPTKLLQNSLWHGYIRWYDFVFYSAYMLHFVLPVALAVVIWKTREAQYWRFITAYLSVSFAAFLTFLAFPAAPPWMASDQHVIEPIVRISSSVFATLDIGNFPSIYNKISPNPVAAMPSLHAAYALLFALFVIRLFKTRWRYVAWIYPLLIWVGTVYQGEHYVIDVLAGILYAILTYLAAPYIASFIQRSWHRLRLKFFVKPPKHAKVKAL